MNASKSLQQLISKQRPATGIKYEPNKQKRIQPESLLIHISGQSQNIDLHHASIAQTTISGFTSKSARVIKEKKPQFFKHTSTQSNQFYNLTGDTTQHITTLNNLTVTNTPYDMVKKIPLNMQFDKEDLYQQLVQMKEQMNIVVQENSVMKAKLRFVERDNEKMQSMISNVGGYLQQTNKHTDQVKLTKMGISENLLTITLKKTIIDLNCQLKLKFKEIKRLSYAVKYTQIQELTVQLEASQMEGMRLRTLLAQQMRNSEISKMLPHLIDQNRSHDFNQYEQKFYFQMQIINQLKQENDFQQGLIRLNEEGRFGLQNQIDAKNLLLNKQQQVLDDLTQNIKQQTHDIDHQKDEIMIYQAQNLHLSSTSQKLDYSQQRVAQLIAQESKLKVELKSKNQSIEYLDKTLTEMRAKLNDKSADEVKQKIFLQDELHKYQRLYEEMDDKYKHMLLIQAQRDNLMSVPDKLRQQLTIAINYKKNAHVTPDSQRVQNNVPKRLRTVKVEDVRIIGWELNQRFQLQRIEMMDVIENYLFNDKNKKNGYIRTRELIKCFEDQPFSIDNSESAVLLARFLIEDNSQDFIEYNLDLQNSIVIVQSIFVKIVGKYKVLTDIEFNQNKAGVIQVMVKYRSSLKQHFDALPSQLDGLISKQEILNTFTIMGIDLSVEQTDFLFLQLFALSNNTEMFPYTKIFDIFAPLRRRSIQQGEEKTKHRIKHTKQKPVEDKEHLQIAKKMFDFHARRSTLAQQ